MGQVTKAEEASCEAMGKTTDAHARLRPFAGTFRAQVRMWMGPGEPMLSSGTMTNTLELGGRYLHHSYKGDPNPGPFPAFEGRGYWGYNTTDNRYEGFWIDNACTSMQLELGQVESSGRVWTMHSSMTSPETGAPMRKKSVITLVDEQRHTMEMYFEAPGGEWRKIMHIEYERV